MIKIPKCLFSGIELPQLLLTYPELHRVMDGVPSIPLIPNYPWLTVEGIDGSGKGLFISRLCRKIEQEGLAGELFRMPGTTEFGEAMRASMKGADPTLQHPSVIVPAMAANTADVLERVIAPRLRAATGRHLAPDAPWLISDRWPLFSGAVYQAEYFQDLPDSPIRLLDLLRAYGIVCPPVVVFMRVDSDTSLSRRPPGEDQFENSRVQRGIFSRRYNELFARIGGSEITKTPAGLFAGMDFRRPAIYVVDNNQHREPLDAEIYMDKHVGTVFELMEGIVRKVER